MRKLFIKVCNGGVLKTSADAIVYSASLNLFGIYGLEGAIHKAAGKELLKECVSLGVCNCDDAKITRGYNLPVKCIIHTVALCYKAGDSEAEKLLISCYRRCVELAIKGLLLHKQVKS